MEKQGEAHRFPLMDGEDDLRFFLLKKPLMQKLRGGHHLVGHMLILRQSPDKG